MPARVSAENTSFVTGGSKASQMRSCVREDLSSLCSD